VELLGQMADKIYLLTDNGDIFSARQILLQMGDLVAAIQWKGVTTLEGLQMITITLVQAKSVFNAVKIVPENVLQAAARIRLIADALTHPNTPIWLQYRKVMTDTSITLAQLIKQQNNLDARQSLLQLQNYFQTIQPAVVVSRNSVELTKIESLFNALNKQFIADPNNSMQLLLLVNQLQSSLEMVFQQKGELATYLNLFSTKRSSLPSVIGIGMIIISALGFTAWRMLRKRNAIVTVNRIKETD